MKVTESLNDVFTKLIITCDLHFHLNILEQVHICFKIERIEILNYLLVLLN